MSNKLFLPQVAFGQGFTTATEIKLGQLYNPNSQKVDTGSQNFKVIPAVQEFEASLDHVKSYITQNKTETTTEKQSDELLETELQSSTGALNC